METVFREPASSKKAGITYHLAIVDEWESQKGSQHYTPGAYAADGFIHCTDGLDLLTSVANVFYKESPEPRTILVLDVSKIDSDVRYEDPDETFPHIFGPLATSAVIAELPVQRDENGVFTRLG